MLRTLWPDSPEVINATSDCPLILTCEHASHHVPPEYSGLGLSTSEAQSHIAWDIGAASLTRSLAARLAAPAFLGRYSRLLIDLNRPLTAPTSIPRESETILIPGNAAVSATERKRRVDKIFEPFHGSVASFIDTREASRIGRGFIVSIHSFTPTYFGRRRPWHVGILWAKASNFGQRILRRLRQLEPSLVIEPNVPYSITPDEDYTILVHGDHRNIPGVLLEVRNDLVSADVGVQRWASTLSIALQEAVSDAQELR
jgi:predicted N-formylglutamate amidohydrolase